MTAALDYIETTIYRPITLILFDRSTEVTCKQMPCAGGNAQEGFAKKFLGVTASRCVHATCSARLGLATPIRQYIELQD